MKIGQKLIGSFAVVAIIGAIIGGVGWYGINTLDKSMDDIASVRLPSVDIILTIDGKIGDIAKQQMELIHPNASVEDAQEIYQKMNTIFGEIDQLQKDYEQYIVDDADKNLFAAFKESYNNYKEQNEKFLAYSKDMDKSGMRDPIKTKLDITEIESSHRKWMFQLSETVVEEKPFAGQLDPTKCALGHWLESFDLDNELIKNTFDEIKTNHDALHASGKSIQEIFASGKTQSNKNKAMKIYDGTSIPAMNNILDLMHSTILPEVDNAAALRSSLYSIEERYLDPSFDTLMEEMETIATNTKDDA